MFENDEDVEAEADPERKKRHTGEDASNGVDADGIGALLNDAVLHGGCDQEADRKRHERKC